MPSPEPHTRDVFNRVSEKLAVKGFKRVDMYTWTYTFPDNKRWIEIEIKGMAHFSVNFSDDEIMFCSPYELLEGLSRFGHVK
jgi:hypothetical protein